MFPQYFGSIAFLLKNFSPRTFDDFPKSLTLDICDELGGGGREAGPTRLLIDGPKLRTIANAIIFHNI